MQVVPISSRTSLNSLSLKASTAAVYIISPTTKRVITGRSSKVITAAKYIEIDWPPAATQKPGESYAKIGEQLQFVMQLWFEMKLDMQRQLEMGLHNGVIGKGDKEEMKSEPESEQKNEQKQDMMEFEDTVHLEARGVPLDDYFNAEVLAKFRAGSDDKSKVLSKLKDILLCYHNGKKSEAEDNVIDYNKRLDYNSKVLEFVKNKIDAELKDMIKLKEKTLINLERKMLMFSDTEDERIQDLCKLAYNDEGKSKLEYELESEPEEKKVDNLKGKIWEEKKPRDETVFGTNKENAGKA